MGFSARDGGRVTDCAPLKPHPGRCSQTPKWAGVTEKMLVLGQQAAHGHRVHCSRLVSTQVGGAVPRCHMTCRLCGEPGLLGCTGVTAPNPQQCTRTLTHTHTRSHTGTHTQTVRHSYTHMNTQIHVQTYAHTHTDTAHSGSSARLHPHQRQDLGYRLVVMSCTPPGGEKSHCLGRFLKQTMGHSLLP